jgi:hypothetical protein
LSDGRVCFPWKVFCHHHRRHRDGLKISAVVGTKLCVSSASLIAGRNETNEYTASVKTLLQTARQKLFPLGSYVESLNSVGFLICNSLIRPDDCNIGCDGLGPQHLSRNSESIRHLLIARYVIIMVVCSELLLILFQVAGS